MKKRTPKVVSYILRSKRKAPEMTSVDLCPPPALRFRRRELSQVGRVSQTGLPSLSILSESSAPGSPMSRNSMEGTPAHSPGSDGSMLSSIRCKERILVPE
ncbi:hypothetical protein PoB_005880300 [Plakobranchus ocellatus]|uniref:Uncharacterized protein n=1 Tax=Plakobranchus ocellatus TaxID=259542 RepID=A0AAV4CKU5_9GAST|nr:hypothetical protein PoB_005880300 [Plakobranchus ocellatus]